MITISESELPGRDYVRLLMALALDERLGIQGAFAMVRFLFQRGQKLDWIETDLVSAEELLRGGSTDLLRRILVICRGELAPYAEFPIRFLTLFLENVRTHQFQAEFGSAFIGVLTKLLSEYPEKRYLLALFLLLIKKEFFIINEETVQATASFPDQNQVRQFYGSVLEQGTAKAFAPTALDALRASTSKEPKSEVTIDFVQFAWRFVRALNIQSGHISGSTVKRVPLSSEDFLFALISDPAVAPASASALIKGIVTLYAKHDAAILAPIVSTFLRLFAEASSNPIATRAITLLYEFCTTSESKLRLMDIPMQRHRQKKLSLSASTAPMRMYSLKFAEFENLAVKRSFRSRIRKTKKIRKIMILEIAAKCPFTSSRGEIYRLQMLPVIRVLSLDRFFS
jgi:hypothetical protein